MGLRSWSVPGRRPSDRRRIGVATAVAMSLTAGVVGLGGVQVASASSSPSVHLTYALWDPVQEVGYKKSIALFEQSHPNISVTVVQIPYPDYESKLTAEFTSGSGPDVFWVNTPSWRSSSKRG